MLSLVVAGEFVLDYMVFQPRRQCSSVTAVSTSNLTTLMFYIKEAICEVNAKRPIFLMQNMYY
jgi:hypothetical protein